MLPHMADIFLVGGIAFVLFGAVGILGWGEAWSCDPVYGWELVNRLVVNLVATIMISVGAMVTFTLLSVANQYDVQGVETYRQWWDNGRETPPSWSEPVDTWVID